MTQIKGIKSTVAGLESIGILDTGIQNWNLSPAELVEETIKRGQGVLADNGGLCVSTGKFTGRSPKDKFCVEDAETANNVWWKKDGGKNNNPIKAEEFNALFDKVVEFLKGRELFVRDAYAGADKTYQLNVRVVNIYPWQNLFANNLFIRPEANELTTFVPEWHVIAVPEFLADPLVDKGIISPNFSLIDFSRKIILIGGSAYTGEMKKGIFTVLNYLLPVKNGVLPMHCSANEGKDGDVAIFFGLSGTGKTTLSADPERYLIGDDEHGWSDTGVFNFEGGCYAKCIDLSKEGEPQIWNAMKHGSLIENIVFYPGTRSINFSNKDENGNNIGVTENTRVAYPIDFIDGAKQPSTGGIPKNIFFLTCDAFGVLPPISKLNAAQAQYLFISGYTSKVAGTEMGITEPTPTFSAGFGAAFLPLHPGKYATLLGEKMEKHGTNVWLINTGWITKSTAKEKRMKLRYTREMISAALEGALDNVEYTQDAVFGMQIPASVPNVPSEVLLPINSWKAEGEEAHFAAQCQKLAKLFNENFKQFEAGVSAEVLAAAPKVAVEN